MWAGMERLGGIGSDWAWPTPCSRDERGTPPASTHQAAQRCSPALPACRRIIPPVPPQPTPASRPPRPPRPPPRPQVLEGLSPGLGWKVFRDFPEQFASPDAVECWRLLAAYLFTQGIEPQQARARLLRCCAPSALCCCPGCSWPSRLHPPQHARPPSYPHPSPPHPQTKQISAMFIRHHVLFKHAVARPDALRRLFAWLQRDLQLAPRSVVRLLQRCPSVLQVGQGGWQGGREAGRESVKG